jgi:hypothetical protein
MGEWLPNLEGRTFGDFAFNVDVSTVCLRNPSADGQPSPRPPFSREREGRLGRRIRRSVEYDPGRYRFRCRGSL